MDSGPALILRPRPTVSVIVPCFNYGHLLEGCLESVLSQREVEVRVLLIDDHSTDDSATLARRLAQRDERIQVRCHSENIGLIATANEGLALAHGAYVVLLSADDLLAPGALQRATSIMDGDERIGMVYGRPLLAYEGRALPRPSGRWRGTTVWSGRDWISLRCRRAQNCISSPEVVVRSAVQQAVGEYDASCRHTSDLNMWLRIAAVCDIAYVRGVPQAIYRIHAGSMLRNQGGPIVDLRERRAAFESFFASCGSQLEGAEQLQASAERALARQALWRASRAIERGSGDGHVEELRDFALDVYRDTRRLREWRGFRMRQRIGAGRSLGFLPFLATGAGHRLQHHVTRLRWRFKGV
jgi:Glycosyl transferase family 2